MCIKWKSHLFNKMCVKWPKTTEIVSYTKDKYVVVLQPELASNLILNKIINKSKERKKRNYVWVSKWWKKCKNDLFKDIVAIKD